MNIVFPEKEVYLGIIKISDSTGKSMITKDLSTRNSNNTYSLDVNRINEDLYFMNITTDNTIITSGFIIKR